jgi:hypothetical protein
MGDAVGAVVAAAPWALLA